MRRLERNSHSLSSKFSRFIDRELCDVGSINEDTALSWVLESRYHIDKRRLSGPGLSYDGDELTFHYLQIQVFKDSH
jgi:hypothetical protein